MGIIPFCPPVQLEWVGQRTFKERTSFGEPFNSAFGAVWKAPHCRIRCDPSILVGLDVYGKYKQSVIATES